MAIPAGRDLKTSPCSSSTLIRPDSTFVASALLRTQFVPGRSFVFYKDTICQPLPSSRTRFLPPSWGQFLPVCWTLPTFKDIISRVSACVTVSWNFNSQASLK